MIARLVSGGQTGVDRAALDAAIELGIPCGGWCPHGRKAEDGTIPDRYPLIETWSSDYSQRTCWNVRDSDATLILAWGELTGGTRLTADECRKVGKPYVVVDLTGDVDIAEAAWTARDCIAENVAGDGTLNVAGPRESEAPGVYDRTRAFLRAVLTLAMGADSR